MGLLKLFDGQEYKPVGMVIQTPVNSFTTTLHAADWQDNQQTISSDLFKSTGYAYIVAPSSASYKAYTEALIYADDVSSDGSMVFHCTNVPTSDLTVNIARMVST